MKLSIASGVARSRSRAAKRALRIFARTAPCPSGADSEPRVPQNRTGIAGADDCTRCRISAGWPASSQAAAASSTEADKGITSYSRLILKTSRTIELSAATAIRRSGGFILVAAIRARNPALEM